MLPFCLGGPPRVLCSPGRLPCAVPLRTAEGKCSSGHGETAQEETCFVNFSMWLLASLFVWCKTVRAEYAQLHKLCIEECAHANGTNNVRLSEALTSRVGCNVLYLCRTSRGVAGAINASRWVPLWLTVNLHKTKGCISCEQTSNIQTLAYCNIFKLTKTNVHFFLFGGSEKLVLCCFQ